MSAMRDIFRLREGEASLAVPLGILLMLNAIALNIADVVSVSGFISDVGTPFILLVWSAAMLALIVVASAQSFVIDRFERLRLLRNGALMILTAYVLLRMLFTFGAPEWLNYSLLYLLGEIQSLFFPLIFWVFANDVMVPAQAKRLFPFIASFAFVGQIIGLGIGALAPDLLTQFNVSRAELLSFNVLLFIAAFIVLSGSISKLKVRETTHRIETAMETLTEGWGFIKEVPSFRFLMVAMLSIFLVLTIFDYNFLFFSDNSARFGGDNFQRFYGLFYLGVTVTAFFVQLIITSRLIEKLQLKSVFIFTPIILLATSITLVGWPVFIVATIGLASGYLTRETISEPAEKAFQSLVPEERRGRVSMFMDSYMYAVGTLLGCLVTGAVLIVATNIGVQPFAIYLPLAVVAALVALWAILSMRSHYDTSLLNWRLKRRTRGASVLDDIEF